MTGVTPKIPRSMNSNEIYKSWREYEINYILKVHNDVDNFCVIDDERFDLTSLEDHLVKVNPKFGLQEEDVEKAIRILKRKGM